ncbi:MAG: prolipoprotein diacylglyceryl transferase, partial [Acidobacteriota bacterium]|nr:prolipoprotein diacylglyceryl transferase [Acidobacteriota bacterium]
PVALARAIGRLGCFSAGCCWGRETSLSALSVVFTDPEAAQQTGVPLNIPLVPTQLIQFGNDLIVALILTFAWRKKLKPDGTVFWLYVLLYSVGRGVIEFWRGDSHRGLFFGGLVSTSQLFALAGVVVALFFLVRNRRAALSARSG